MKPFDLVVYSIVALVLVIVLFTLWGNLFPPENLTDTIKDQISTALSEGGLGHTLIIGTKTIPEGTMVSKGAFDTAELSFAVECSSPRLCCENGQICEKPIEWNYERISFKSSQTITLSLRCQYIEKVPVCRAYFGDLPAQADINKVVAVGVSSTNTTIKVVLKNIGKNTLTGGVNSVTLEKYVSGQWADTGKEFPTQETETLTPNATQDLLWNMEVATSGKYKATFKFEGLNSGFDYKTIDFNIGENRACSTIIGSGETVSNPDSTKFREIHYCTGCNYAYECVSAWSTYSPGSTFEILTKDSTYCLKDTESGSCA
ncbi:MAG: hypothetical protein AABW59_02600 [archaeon]